MQLWDSGTERNNTDRNLPHVNELYERNNSDIIIDEAVPEPVIKGTVPASSTATVGTPPPDKAGPRPGRGLKPSAPGLPNRVSQPQRIALRNTHKFLFGFAFLLLFDRIVEQRAHFFGAPPFWRARSNSKLDNVYHSLGLLINWRRPPVLRLARCDGRPVLWLARAYTYTPCTINL